MILPRFASFLALVGLAAASACGQATDGRDHNPTALEVAFNKERNTLAHRSGMLDDDPYAGHRNVHLDVYLRDGKVVYLRCDSSSNPIADAILGDYRQQFFSIQDGEPMKAAEIITRLGVEHPATPGDKGLDVSFGDLLTQELAKDDPTRIAENAAKPGTERPASSLGEAHHDPVSRQEWDLHSTAETPRQQEMLDHAKFLCEQLIVHGREFKQD